MVLKLEDLWSLIMHVPLNYAVRQCFLLTYIALTPLFESPFLKYS